MHYKKILIGIALGLLTVVLAATLGAFDPATVTVPSGSPVAGQKGESLAPLTKWVGHVPLAPNAQDFWTDPLLVRAARKVLDVDRFSALFDGYARQVVTPVAQRGAVLSAFACKEHACDSHNVRLYVDLEKEAVFVCWHETGVSDLWLALGHKPRDIGADGCVKADDFGVYDLYRSE